MQWESIVTAAIGMLGGAGGVVGFYRTRSQNKVDERAQLSAEQQALWTTMRAELDTMRASVAALSAEKERVDGKLDEQREALVELRTLDKVKTRQIEQLEQRNRDLEQKLVEQSTQLQQLREQKDATERQLIAVTAARDFLERENTGLRRENELLRTAHQLNSAGVQ